MLWNKNLDTVLSGSNFIRNDNFATAVSDFPISNETGWQIDLLGPSMAPNFVTVETFAQCFDNPLLR